MIRIKCFNYSKDEMLNGGMSGLGGLGAYKAIDKLTGVNKDLRDLGNVSSHINRIHRKVNNPEASDTQLRKEQQELKSKIEKAAKKRMSKIDPSYKNPVFIDKSKKYSGTKTLSVDTKPGEKLREAKKAYAGAHRNAGIHTLKKHVRGPFLDDAINKARTLYSKRSNLSNKAYNKKLLSGAVGIGTMGTLSYLLDKRKAKSFN